MGDASVVPPTNIVRVLVDYVGPLLNAILADADPERTEDLLLLGAVVWNAVVEERGNADQAARKLIADMKLKVLFPPSDAMVEWLAHRKVSLFSDDARLIQGEVLAREIDRVYDLVAGVSE